MEILDVVDETGTPTGETVERAEAHREGVRHRTSHVWIARNRNGRIITEEMYAERFISGLL